ncbi:cell division protein ZapE [Faecalibacterium prausnitzii]|uniref:ATP-binding protein n=1 Tax=Faecalibacterium prausnitzii TaxID=853 RepID=UPI000E46B2AE|nr:ATP-binding protein [Faecalibacterium prausnitzii]RHC41695.1 cell division protein ZapE [Faecalibacterium prausnitzii]
MKTIEKILEQSVSSIPENTEDYYGKDGLLYCGKCHTPKEAFFAKGVALMSKNKHPVECSCQRTEREKQEALINQQKHLDRVRRLKAEGFSDPAMLDWKFENDNGRNPQMHHAHRYVEQWQTMRSENLGLLLWGGVGTGKSFLAGCIANALMEQEVPVRMTNFARILNELNNSFSGRNEAIDKLCRYPLLIIDDFGMERGTDYALEQIYNIVDSRYRSRKPLIVTTNLTLDEIRHPQDTAHARIYDRLLEMCIPVSCIGVSFRKENAQEKLERMKLLIG